MNLDKMTLAYGAMFAFALILICVSENTLLNTSAYAQALVNNSNETSGTLNSNMAQTGNVTGSNTTAIPYVLNVTNSSDTSSQAVDQVIQAISGGQSTSLQQVLDAAGNGNSSSSSLEQVIDAASSVLNNQSANLSSGNISNNMNISSDLP
jgi:formate/nitrite transporter FocA (FNT family)